MEQVVLKRLLLALASAQVLLVGCSSNRFSNDRLPQIEPDAELVLRSSSLNNRIRAVKSTLDVPDAMPAHSILGSVVIVYITGPDTVVGSVASPQGKVLRYEVTDTRKLLGTRAAGVRIEALVQASKSTSAIVIQYTLNGRVYTVRADKSSQIQHLYLYYPPALELDRRRPVLKALSVSANIESGTVGDLVALERGESSSLYYYLPNTDDADNAGGPN